jgi:hypothetical protein
MAANPIQIVPLRSEAAAECIWAAGFFDAEGYVGGKPRSVRIYISQTDPFVLHRFRDAVTVGTVRGPRVNQSNLRKGVGGKPYWEFRASSRADVVRVYKLLRDWLSPVKRAQFDESVELLGPDYRVVCRKCGRLKDEKRSDGPGVRCSFCRRVRQGLKGPRVRVTHCKHGHEFTPANTYTWAGRRHCRICRREANRRRV